MEKLLEDGIIADGTLAQDETQAANLWSLRESLPEAAGKLGKVMKYDVSLPLSEYYSLVEETRARFVENGMAEDGTIKTTVGYGHIGDSASPFPLLSTSPLSTRRARRRRRPSRPPRRRSSGSCSGRSPTSRA